MKETETNKPLEVIDVVEIPQEALDEAAKKQQTAKNNADNDTQEPSEELPTLKEIIENRAIEGERPMSKTLRFKRYWVAISLLLPFFDAIRSH